ncbi:MAG: hydantoinase/oxoprolinase family protein, partial [Chloroflexi bacterium]|nr:hydantoinase/oxoprolinase family protein [Chloroflexota bacterium]
MRPPSRERDEELQGVHAHGGGPREGGRSVRESVRRERPVRLPALLLPLVPAPPRDGGLPQGRAGPARRGDRAVSYRIGVDTGGTFTDCIVIDDQGNVTASKAPSTPNDFSVGVMDSLGRAAKALGITTEKLLAETTSFGHGTTVATNALLTMSGSKTGLLTTRGHEDTMFMGRIKQKIAGLDEDQIHDFYLHDKAIPGIVPRKFIRGIDERVDYKGAVVVAMRDDQVRAAAKELVDAGCDSIAIAFLWAFLDPSHEQRARELVQKDHPKVALSLSSDIAPVMGEYERTASTVVNAYLSKKVDTYIAALADRLRKAGFKQELMVMTSNGGVAPAEQARQRAAYLLASGPAGGVIGS